MRSSLLVAMVALLGCGAGDPKASGEPCVASSECGPGLLCDLAADMPTCTTMGTPPPPDAGPAADADPNAADAAVGTPDAASQVDASMIDAAPPADASPPDASPPDASPPDASPPDAAP